MSNELNPEVKAIQQLVNSILGAFESGLVSENKIKLSDLYSVAQMHCNDNYGQALPSLEEYWGEELAKELRKPDWTPLSEKLPSDSIGGHYIIKVTNDVTENNVCQAIYCNGEFWHESELRKFHSGRPYVGVTHRMEYPDPEEKIVLIADTKLLTRDEAYEALAGGKIVSHGAFEAGEWLIRGKADGTVNLGEGLEVDLANHWKLYDMERFDSGWFVLNQHSL